MKRYKDKAKECEMWHDQVKLWDNVAWALREVPAYIGGKEQPTINRLDNRQTEFDKHYKELFWAHNSNQHPSGRKRLS